MIQCGTARVKAALLPYCGGVVENKAVAKYLQKHYGFRVVAKFVPKKDTDAQLPPRPQNYWPKGVATRTEEAKGAASSEWDGKTRIPRRALPTDSHGSYPGRTSGGCRSWKG